FGPGQRVGEGAGAAITDRVGPELGDLAADDDARRSGAFAVGVDLEVGRIARPQQLRNLEQRAAKRQVDHRNDRAPGHPRAEQPRQIAGGDPHVGAAIRGDDSGRASREDERHRPGGFEKRLYLLRAAASEMAARRVRRHAVLCTAASARRPYAGASAFTATGFVPMVMLKRRSPPGRLTTISCAPSGAGTAVSGVTPICAPSIHTSDPSAPVTVSVEVGAVTRSVATAPGATSTCWTVVKLSAGFVSWRSCGPGGSIT